MNVNDFLKMISDMKHTLGIDLTKLRKGQLKYNAYRNYFCGNSKYLDEGCKLGFVDKQRYVNQWLYMVTEAGLNFLSSLFGIEIVWNK